MTRLLLCTGLAAAGLSILGSTYYVTVLKSRKDRKHLREKLPNSIYTWRLPTLSSPPLEEEELWQDLTELFETADLIPWKYSSDSEIVAPTKYVSANGFAYVTSNRGLKGDDPGTATWLRFFNYMNPLTRAAQTKDGQPVMVRVMTIKDEGHEMLSIVRKIAAGPLALLSNNHCLPLIKEFTLHDIIFGIFPRTGDCFDHAWSAWAKNSVGDILDMILQIMEGVVFLHDQNIAHRDLFNGNFLVDWHPESLLSKEVSVSRPRVHIIDFEFAVEFPTDCPTADRVCTGVPCTRWYKSETYSRPCPPELRKMVPYCPFKLDVWQLGWSFTCHGLKTGILDIDELLLTMKSKNAAERPTAKEAFTKLRQLVYSIPPESLLVPPNTVR